MGLLSTSHQCRLCGAPLTRTFVDLGMSPLCESYVPDGEARRGGGLLPASRSPVRRVPAGAASRVRVRRADLLRLRVLFVVLRLVGGAREAVRRGDDRAAWPDLRTAWSPKWPATTATCCSTSCGRDPGARRRAGRERGRGGPRPRHPTEVQFLGAETGREIAQRHGRADLVAANNVFAHVPDIRGFAAGLRALVKDDGMVTLEFPHLLRLIERRQYDTIYHEHFSYLSLLTSSRALATAGLRVVDVEELGTHGDRCGSTPVPRRTAASRPSGSRRYSPRRRPSACTRSPVTRVSRPRC